MPISVPQICAALLVIMTVAALIIYFIKSSAYKKGNYGKNTVNSALTRFAKPRNMKVLSDVCISDGKETVSFDHVLIGYFGVLFVQSIQGKGSFWGDGRQEIWAFTNGSKEKILFKNPIAEMEEKIKFFRKVLAENKIYSVPVESTIVISTISQNSKMYLSNISNPNSLILDENFNNFLQQDFFIKDNGVFMDKIIPLFKNK